MKPVRSEPGRERRRYHSPLRRRRAAETRERIILAGADLLHGYPVWNWRALTVRAVAERAEVNERTVYRHFANERELREAVLLRLEEEARVELEGLELGEVEEVAARTLEFVSTFPIEPRAPVDPTLAAAGQRQRDALLSAIAPFTGRWSKADRVLGAAMLDVLWSVASYERLVANWGLDPDEAIRGVTWAIGLVEDAVGEGRRPKPRRSGRKRRRDGRHAG